MPLLHHHIIIIVIIMLLALTVNQKLLWWPVMCLKYLDQLKFFFVWGLKSQPNYAEVSMFRAKLFNILWKKFKAA
jgi:hypothetical protein